MKLIRLVENCARQIDCLVSGPSCLRPIAVLAIAVLMGSSVNAVAQSSLVADRPYLGWSSFSEQTVSSSFLTQDNIEAQSDALLSSGLQQHGFTYINIDAGWQKGFDANGRPTPDASLFSNLTALISHIHSNGQKAGIYWRPGADRQVAIANPQILETNYRIKDILATPNSAGNAFAASDPIRSLSNFKIDYSKQGAQEYIDSIIALFASWGVDYIRLDGVAPGSATLSLDNQLDVMAWSKAITQSHRPIWLTISWAIDQDYFNTWQQYSSARRISADLECEGRCSTLTSWPLTSQRWSDLLGWQNYAGPQSGWNDLGPLNIGNTASDGLNAVEQQSAITLWAMANAPLYIGGDLTKLDSTGLDLLTNDEVLAVDQSGFPASQLAGGMTPIWVSNPGDGSFYVALFNLNAFPSPVSIKWSALGFLDAPQVRDVWSRRNLGRYDEQFSAVILGHGVRLLRVFSRGVADRQLSQSYVAYFGLTHGKTAFIACKACSTGHEVVNLGLGKNNTVTLDNVYSEHPGTFRMEINAAMSGSSDLFYQVNGGVPTSVKVGGGSFNLPSSTSVPIKLAAGYNSIQFGNPTGVAPNLDQIGMSGDGHTTPPTFAVYDAETGNFDGTAINSPCQYCSGNTKISGLGMGGDNALTFPDITVAGAGMYHMEIDYLTKVPRLLYMTVNGGDPVPLNLTGDSEDSPTSLVIPVGLKDGKNTVRFGNPDEQAPALDKIALAPPLASTDLTVTLGLQKRSGPSTHRIWTLNLANMAPIPAEGGQLNLLSFVQVSAARACQPKVLASLPINVGTIPKQDARSLEVPIDFSSCSNDALFNASIVYSSDHGAVVGNAILTGLSQ
jgi:alpha-galactosidase